MTVTLRGVTDAACLPPDDGEAALNELVSVGMIEVAEDGAYCISNWEKRQSSQSPDAIRQRKCRDRKRETGRDNERDTTRDMSRDSHGIDIRSKKLEDNNPPISPLGEREKKILSLVAPYTMTPKEIQTLLETFSFSDEEIVAAMSHPKAKSLKSAYLYLRNWLKRGAGKPPSEFRQAVSKMFDQFSESWPNRDCLGEARHVFLNLFPEDEDRGKGRERVRAINAHARVYLDRTEAKYVMRLSKWLRTTDFSLAPELKQEPGWEVGE